MKNKYIVLFGILALGGVLLFSNLGDQYLWQDEAETAQLAKNTLKFGFPRAWDGTNLVNPRIRTGYGPDHGWRYHPWGQFYLAAASFYFLGTSTFAARFPFALLGLVNIFLLYLFVYRSTGKRTPALIASFLMAVSVPYLLLMRQCRYYAPAVLLVLLALILYLEFLRKRSGFLLAGLSVSLVLLAYTVHGMFLPVSAALFLHFTIFAFDKKLLLKMVPAGVIVVLAAIPWFIYSNSGAHVGDISPERLFKNLEFQIRMINKYIFPAFFFLSVYVFRILWKRRWKIRLGEREKNSLRLLGCVILATLCAFCFPEERNFRYLVFFIPLFSFIEGLILLRLLNYSRTLFVSFVLISVFTGIFNMGTPNFFLPKYLYEITHEYKGPIEGIVKFLEENASEGDEVKIIYGDLPLMFYTDLRIDNSQIYDEEHMPEWIIFRRGWHERLDNKYYTRVAESYKKHIIDYPDIKWENRPGDLSYHRFSTDTKAPGVVIFEKLD
ncbi:MAG: phospholipid carrier-dependent glycosyltransferase [Candidatus Omnitrophica bacterium]|nr:phospholipid carrier-dependent glycosyltransferase [Candidatus Omnitrophota bacterium]